MIGRQQSPCIRPYPIDDQYVMEHQLVTTLMFAAVQAAIGAAVKLIAVTAIARPLGHAEGSRQRYLLASVVQRMLSDLRPQLLHQRQGMGSVGIAQQNAELLPAKPGQQVGTTQAPLQTVADMAQSLIPGVVAPAIIDSLEMVKIENHQYQCMATAACQGDAVAQFTLKAAAIGHTGQTVGFGHLAQQQLRRRPPTLVHMYEQHDQQPAKQRVAQVDQPCAFQLLGVLEHVGGDRDHGKGHSDQEAGPFAQQQVGHHRDHEDPDEGRHRGLGHDDDVDKEAVGRQQIQVDPRREVADPPEADSADQQQKTGAGLDGGQQGVAIEALQYAEEAYGQAGGQIDHAQQGATVLLLQTTVRMGRFLAPIPWHSFSP